MQLVDANVLLYAVNEDAPHHEAARPWLDGALGGREPVGFAWIVLLAFMRLSTGAFFPRPLPLEDAFGVADSWLGAPAAIEVHPTERHLTLLHGLLADVGTAANLVNDAHLAALAIEHRAEIVSYDTDFARFSGVRWSPPRPNPG